MPSSDTNRIAQDDVYRVIAFICGTFVVVLLSLSLASTDWLMSNGWRQGLFMHCIDPDADLPLPFNVKNEPGCHWSRDVAYIHFTCFLCIFALILDFLATLCTALGLRTKDYQSKYVYYKRGAIIMCFALIVLVVGLGTYPFFFQSEINNGNREIWEFGWAYGVAWGAAIFLLGGFILLLCDKESEEIYYKERKIVHDANHTRT